MVPFIILSIFMDFNFLLMVNIVGALG